MTASPLACWYQIVQEQNPQGLDSLLSEEIIFYSPVAHTPQVGKAIATKFLTAAFKVFFNEPKTSIQATEFTENTENFGVYAPFVASPKR